MVDTIAALKQTFFTIMNARYWYRDDAIANLSAQLATVVPRFSLGTGAASGSGAAGDFYFDTSAKVLYFYDGSTWNTISYVAPPPGP